MKRVANRVNNMSWQKISHFGQTILNSGWKLWLMLFAYPLTVAFFVQLVLLPHIFPAWHAGNGLLIGGDWVSFHRLALSLAEQIQAQGWQAWTITPGGQPMSGIAAIFYVLITPQPWAVIPLNAALHATAAFLLFHIVLGWVQDRRIAFLSVLPFWLYPSALTWYAQMHNDTFFIFGFILFVWALLQFLQFQSLPILFRNLALLALGVFLIGLVRPYALEMLQWLSLVAMLFAAVILVRRAALKQQPWQYTVGALVLFALIFTLMRPATVQQISRWFRQPAAPVQRTELVTKPRQENLPVLVWTKTGFPDFMEQRAFRLAETRDKFRFLKPHAKSNIDEEIGFSQMSDIIFYLPRALQIAFLAPFPADWFGEGSYEQNTLMRRISAFEMIGIYLALAFLPYAVWRWRTNPQVWMVLMLCVGMMLIYTLVVVNIGTLYRFRYGFMMTIVALGLSGALAWLFAARNNKNTSGYNTHS
jgi:hypothetical protein